MMYDKQYFFSNAICYELFFIVKNLRFCGVYKKNNYTFVKITIKSTNYESI